MSDEHERPWREPFYVGLALGAVATFAGIGVPMLAEYTPRAVAIVLAFASLGVSVLGFPIAGAIAAAIYARRESHRTGYTLPLTDGGWAAVRTAMVASGVQVAVSMTASVVVRDTMERVRMPCFDPHAMVGGLVGLFLGFVCLCFIGAILAFPGGLLGAWLGNPKTG